MNIDNLCILNDKEKEEVRILKDWIPKKMIDVHVHVWKDSKSKDLINSKAMVPGQTFQYFSWKMHRKIIFYIFGDLKYVWTIFGFPFYRERETNDYVRILSREFNSEVVPFLLSTEINNVEYIKKQLFSGNFFGFKGYASSGQKSVSETKIADFFPYWVLRIADDINLPIVLHLPRDIIHNLDELLSLAKKYPRASFIVAHMGNIYYYDKNIVEAYKEVGRQDNIYFDTAMVADSDVIAEGLLRLGESRILFGSDAPFSYLRGRHAPIQGEVRFQSQVKFNWVFESDFSEYCHDAPGFMIMHLNIIKAIKEALKKVGLSSSEPKEKIFAHNFIRIKKQRRLS